jgi:acetoin utilization protein AcuA
LPVKKTTILTTPKGAVRVGSFVRPSEMQRLHFDPLFRKHESYQSLYTSKADLQAKAAREGADVVVALTDDDCIVGFGVLAYPEPQERWAQLRSGRMLEVEAIEVSRAWRSLQIGKALLEKILAYPEAEEKILYMVGYSWTWDLEAGNMTGAEYRHMMIRLFSPYGFQEYKTNEPNICLRPENIFMARIGRNVAAQVVSDFKWLRFGISPLSTS